MRRDLGSTWGLLPSSVGQHSQCLLRHGENQILHRKPTAIQSGPYHSQPREKIASGSLQVLRADRVSVTVACEYSRALEVTQAFLHVSFASIYGGRLLGPMVQKLSISQGQLIRRHYIELQLCKFVVGRCDLAGIEFLVTLPIESAPTLGRVLGISLVFVAIRKARD